MKKPTNIRLSWAMLLTDDGEVRIEGHTEKGTQFVIGLPNFDTGAAQCALTKLADYMATKIENERRHHNWIRDRAAKAWRTVDAAIKNETPGEEMQR